MPPTPRFSADQIVAAALALTRTDGIDAVTARNVASELGCSTGPLFTHFESMPALHERLLDEIIGRFLRAAIAVGTGDPLADAGVAWLQFAAEEPRLYEAIFLRRHPWHAKWGPIRRQLAGRMRSHGSYAHLSERACFALVGRASIALHGLGLEIWAGRLPQRDFARLVDEVARPVVAAAMNRGWLDDLHVGGRDHDHDTRGTR